MDNEYDGHWIETLHVPKFHYLDPKPEEIDIRDIARALSMTCRYGGHVARFYSVAEHSCRMSGWTTNQLNALACLLHDAEEAYLPDIPRPIKYDMPEARNLYLTLNERITDKFNLRAANWAEIRELDDRICYSEAKALGLRCIDWAPLGKPLKLPKDIGWASDRAEKMFLKLFEFYSGKTEVFHG